jgi:putative hydrolase of the HAD superfamily
MRRRTKGCILFDWGDTLMRDFKEFNGPMKDWPRVEAVPGAAELLACLHTDWILAIATNADVSTEADIRSALQRVNLERWLDKIYCYKKIGHKKPSPEFFTYILNDLKLTPKQVIMVGDNYETDVLGANRSSLRAVWFNERSQEAHTEDMVRTIHQLGELPAIIDAWIKP